MKELLLTNIDGLFALVDDEDFERVNKLRWRIDNGYVVSAGGERVRLHHFILSKNSMVDHIDQNPLNNQKNNLRFTTFSQNRQNSKLGKNNTSGYRGVTFFFRRNKYAATIYVNGERIHLGMFKTAERAAEVYNEAALKHYGPQSKLNILPILSV